MRPYVSAMSTNLKSPTGSVWRADLPRLLCLVGRNAAGKTRYVQALQLAYGGYADDVAGRDGVRDTGLLVQMGPLRGAPGDELFVEALHGDGVQVFPERLVWSCSRSEKGAASKPEHRTPPDWDQARRMPLAHVYDVLRRDAKAARAAVLAWAGAACTREEVHARIPAPLRAKYADIEEKTAPKGEYDAAVALRAVVEYARKRKRECEGEARGAEKLLAQVGGTLPAAPTQAQCTAAANDADRWRRTVQAAEQQERDQVAAQARRESAERAQRQAEQIQAEQQERQTLLAQWEAYRAALGEAPVPPARDREADQALDALRTILDRALAVGMESCPACGSAVGRAALEAQRAALQPYLDVRFVVQGDGRESERVAADAQIATLRRQVADADAALRTLATVQDAALPQAQPDQALAGGVSLEAARAALAEAEARKAQLEDAARDWARASAARDTVAAMQADSATYDQLAGACNTVINDLLKGSVGAFEARVSAFLPPPEAGCWRAPHAGFGVQLDDEGRQVCRLGLRRDVQGFPFLDVVLSGLEETLVYGAVAMAIAPPTGPAIILPRERDIDAEALFDLLEAWGRFDGQVVVTTTKQPYRKGARKPPGGFEIREVT